MGTLWQTAWRQLRWSLAQRGARETLRVMRQRMGGRRQPGAGSHASTRPHPFDEQYGVDTSGFIGGGALSDGGVNDRFITAYHAVPPSRLRNALEQWRGMPGTRALEEYAFVDIGCGKGRATMIASEMPFREVVGIEMSPGLVATARDNLRLWQQSGRAQSPVRLIEGDATNVELPALPLLVFLYNPFQAPVLRLLLTRLSGAAGERSGLIDLIYSVPSQEAVFKKFPEFEQMWSRKVGMSEQDAAADTVSSVEDRCSLWRR